MRNDHRRCAWDLVTAFSPARGCALLLAERAEAACAIALCWSSVTLGLAPNIQRPWPLLADGPSAQRVRPA